MAMKGENIPLLEKRKTRAIYEQFSTHKNEYLNVVIFDSDKFDKGIPSILNWTSNHF